LIPAFKLNRCIINQQRCWIVECRYNLGCTSWFRNI